MRTLRVDSGCRDERDRRAEARFPAVENASQLTWRDGGQLRSTAAQLMDVSRGGLLMLADDAPPLGLVIRVRLTRPVETPWVEAEVVESSRIRQGPHQLRLTFCGAPTPGFLDVAIDLCGRNT